MSTLDDEFIILRTNYAKVIINPITSLVICTNIAILLNHEMYKFGLLNDNWSKSKAKWINDAIVFSVVPVINQGTIIKIMWRIIDIFLLEYS